MRKDEDLIKLFDFVLNSNLRLLFFLAQKFFFVDSEKCFNFVKQKIESYGNEKKEAYICETDFVRNAGS